MNQYQDSGSKAEVRYQKPTPKKKVLGLNPRSKKNLNRNKSSNKMFENNRQPLVHDDYVKVGPHLPRY